tara:strand:+ start:224 stop:343 length:120 start_codon:yes stop_codon:yes gene_type:complete
MWDRVVYKASRGFRVTRVRPERRGCKGRRVMLALVVYKA